MGYKKGYMLVNNLSMAYWFIGFIFVMVGAMVHWQAALSVFVGCFLDNLSKDAAEDG